MGAPYTVVEKGGAYSGRGVFSGSTAYSCRKGGCIFWEWVDYGNTAYSCGKKAIFWERWVDSWKVACSCGKEVVGGFFSGFRDHFDESSVFWWFCYLWSYFDK